MATITGLLLDPASCLVHEFIAAGYDPPALVAILLTCHRAAESQTLWNKAIDDTVRSFVTRAARSLSNWPNRVERACRGTARCAITARTLVWHEVLTRVTDHDNFPYNAIATGATTPPAFFESQYDRFVAVKQGVKITHTTETVDPAFAKWSNLDVQVEKTDLVLTDALCRNGTISITVCGRAAIVKARKNAQAHSVAVRGDTNMDTFNDIDVQLTWPEKITARDMKRVFRVVTWQILAILTDAFTCADPSDLDLSVMDTVGVSKYSSTAARSKVKIACLRDFYLDIRPADLDAKQRAPKVQLIVYKQTPETLLPFTELTAPARFDFVATGVVAVARNVFVDAIPNAQAFGRALTLSLTPCLLAVEPRSLRRIAKYIADGWTLDPYCHMPSDAAALLRKKLDADFYDTNHVSNYDYVRANVHLLLD